MTAVVVERLLVVGHDRRATTGESTRRRRASPAGASAQAGAGARTMRSRRRTARNSIVAAASDDRRLAGEPERRAQEDSRVRRGRRALGAVEHLDDALATATRAPARGRHAAPGRRRSRRASGRTAARRTALRRPHRSASRRAQLGLPGAPIVDLVVAAADSQLALDSRRALVAAAELRGAVVEAVLVRAAAGRTGRSTVAIDVGEHEDRPDPIEPLRGRPPGRSARSGTGSRSPRR